MSLQAPDPLGGARDDPRRVILDAARALLVESGDEGLTIRRLAGRCGYAAPTIYHHFRDKTGLIDAVLEEVFRELVADLESVPVGGDALQAMRAQFRAIVDFGLRHPTYYRLISTARPGGAEPVPAGEEARLLLERPLESLAAAGRLRIADLETAKQALWVLLHGMISLRTARPDVDWSKELVDVALETMIRGLVRPPGSGEDGP